MIAAGVALLLAGTYVQFGLGGALILMGLLLIAASQGKHVLQPDQAPPQPPLEREHEHTSASRMH